MQGLQASLKARTLRSSQGGRSCWPFTTAWQETRIGSTVLVTRWPSRPCPVGQPGGGGAISECIGALALAPRDSRAARERAGDSARAWRLLHCIARIFLGGDPQSVRKRLQPERRAWRAAQGIASNLRTLGTLLDEGAARSGHAAWRNAARQGRSIARPDGAGRRLALPRKHAVHAWRFCPRARPP